MMLSRVAESVYWMARYVERVENTARMINVNANLVLDLPRNIDFGWEPLIAITGSEDLFHASYEQMDERSVVRFLVTDRRNTSSIISSLHAARENLRSTRDIVPREAWEQLNNLYLYARQRTAGGVPKRARYDFLKHLISQCQMITGLLAGTMSQNEAYRFVKLGRNLERGDMTTRILDVRSEDLLPKQAEDLTPFENIQWMSVLKSMTAYQMYRHHVRVRVRGPDVLRFLLQNRDFPRAVAHTLVEVETCLHGLPRNETALRLAGRLQRRIQEADVHALARGNLHEFLDGLQLEIAGLHDDINEVYFT